MSTVRIENVPLESKQQIRVALQSVYGIGNTRAKNICTKLGMPFELIVRDLTDEQVKQLQDAVGQYTTEGDLRRDVVTRIKRLKDIGCYRGRRHRANLPLRGQRTRTNARTRRPRKKKESK